MQADEAALCPREENAMPHADAMCRKRASASSPLFQAAAKKKSANLLYLSKLLPLHLRYCPPLPTLLPLPGPLTVPNWAGPPMRPVEAAKENACPMALAVLGNVEILRLILVAVIVDNYHIYPFMLLREVCKRWRAVCGWFEMFSFAMRRHFFYTYVRAPKFSDPMRFVFRRVSSGDGGTSGEALVAIVSIDKTAPIVLPVDEVHETARNMCISVLFRLREYGVISYEDAFDCGQFFPGNLYYFPFTVLYPLHRVPWEWRM